MKIELQATTFDVDQLWTLTLSIFVEAFRSQGEVLKPPYAQPAFYEFYELHILYPIDDIDAESDAERRDFYAAISTMSWAVYRAWVAKVFDEKSEPNCFHEVSKDEVIRMFLENLNCEEGKTILERVDSAGLQTSSLNR